MNNINKFLKYGSILEKVTLEGREFINLNDLNEALISEVDQTKTFLWGKHLDVLSDQVGQEVVRNLMALTDASDWDKSFLEGLVQTSVYQVLRNK